jgi:hypothetical protein
MEEGKREKQRESDRNAHKDKSTQRDTENHRYTQIEILPQRYKTQRHIETLVQTGKINSNTEGHKLTQLNRETQIHI